MNTQSFKRFMPLFAFFLMLAAADAVETVTTRLWRIEYPSGTQFSNVQFSKKDKFIVVCDNNYFYFLNPSDGQLIKKIDARKKDLVVQDRFICGTINFIDNDNEFLFESEDRTTIDCYSTTDFTKLYSIENAGGEIYDYAISKDEKYLVATVGDKNLKLWDLASKTIIANYTQPTEENEMSGWISYPGFAQDSNYVIATYYCKTKTGTINTPPFYTYNEYKINKIFNFNLEIAGAFELQNRFIWSKSSKYLAEIIQYYTDTEHIAKVIIYDAASKQEIKRFSIPYAAIVKYFFTNDEEYLVFAYGMSEDICRVYRIKDSTNTINYQTGSASGAALSNSGNELVLINANVVFLYPFSTTSSVANSNNDTNLIIFPNPLSCTGVLKFNQDVAGISSITISDELGNLVKIIGKGYYEAGQQVIKIDVSDLANGAYFVTVANDTQNFTHKFIVNK